LRTLDVRLLLINGLCSSHSGLKSVNLGRVQLRFREGGMFSCPASLLLALSLVVVPRASLIQQGNSTAGSVPQSKAEQSGESRTGQEQSAPNAEQRIAAPSPVRQPDIVIRLDQEQTSSQQSSTVGWAKLIFGAIFPWPLLISLLLVYILFADGAPARIETLLRPFESIKLFGQEFVLNRQGGENAEAAIAIFRKEISNQFDEDIKKFSLAEKHKELFDKSIALALPQIMNREVRSTIYVMDRLFDGRLYQLLDYYPVTTIPGRGRTFSTRYGIIGKAWRLGDSQYDPTVPTSEKQLILEWGMTREEAEDAGHGRQSFACIILKDDGQDRLALVYFDSPQKDAFGDRNTWEKVNQTAQASAGKMGLTAALKSIHLETLKMGPRIHV